MARTKFKKRVINGKSYFHHRITHKSFKAGYKDLYGKTTAELQEKIDKITKELHYNIKDNKKYFSDFLSEWLFNVKFLNIKPSTQALYEGIYRVHIKDNNLLKIKVNDITIADIQRYYKNLLKTGATPHTIKSIHTIIAPCIRYAYNNDLIIKDFTKAIELPKESEKMKLEKEEEVQPLTKEEQQIFIQAIKGHKFEMIFTLALYSGLRQGELLALTWDDININECYVDVNKTMSEVAEVSEEGRGKIKHTLQTPKTKTSIRTVQIPSSVINMLLEHKEKQKIILNKYRNLSRFKDYNLVFSNKYGNYLSPRQLRQTFKDILTDNNIKPRKFHNLRHTYATRLFERGVNPKTVQKLLGHSKLTVTMDTYTHVLDNVKEKAVNELDILFNEFNGVE